MADELTLEIVTPEQMTFRGVVEEVTIPGTEGEFGVLKGHLITGVIHYQDDRGQLIPASSVL